MTAALAGDARLEDRLPALDRNHGAVVAHGEPEGPQVLSEGHGQAAVSRFLQRVDGVVDQVVHHLLQLAAVALPP